jgi:glucose-6-phosphate isomerase
MKKTWTVLNFFSGKTMDFVNKRRFRVPCLPIWTEGTDNVLNIPEISEYYFGEMVYFFEKACENKRVSAGVNPLDPARG